MASNVDKYLKMGYRKFQLKVGGKPQDDIKRIRYVRELLDKETINLQNKKSKNNILHTKQTEAEILLYNNHLKDKDLTFVNDIDYSINDDNLHIPLLCDANTGWLRHEAIQIVNAVKDLDVYIEQPCVTYEECLGVRKATTLPMVLDECIDDIGTYDFGSLKFQKIV